ncbi:MAG: hypothetical protein RL001_49 [Pseudomonadota bacterium]|jgi:type III secretion system YscD/HrpQ family protein|nr:EscD/YscD/HrpQ family type III secretion system inner membrane ring protein [Oxalobacteraceae bacterium]
MKLEPSLETLQQQIELRVLLGPQAGSRLTLAPGDYDLGGGDDCSIILSGPKIRALHARLSFDGEIPYLTPVEGSICDTQGNEITETIELDLGMPIEIGGIWISVDDVEAEWPNPTDVLPIAPPVAHPEPHEQAAEKPDATSSPTAAKASHARKIFIAVGASVSIVVVIAIGAVLWEGHLAQPQNRVAAQARAPVSDPPSLRKVRDIVATSGVGASIEISATRDHTVLVRGFVPDERTKSTLQQALLEVTPAPKIELFVDAELMATAIQLIAEKIDPARAKLRVESVNGGILSLEGAVVSQSVRESVMDLLSAGVPGLKRIHSSIILAEDLPQLLQDQLSEAGLLKKMQIIEKQPEFILRGTLNEDDMRRWETLIVNYTERYGKLLPVKASLRLALRKPPVQVQTIVGGVMPFVVTESGDRITRGGDINGNTLLIVKDNEIIFEGSERFRIAR